MTHWAELILMLAVSGAGCAVVYLVLLFKTRQMLNERHMRVADQLAALDDAIRALETRLAEHHLTPVVAQSPADENVKDQTQPADDSASIAPDIQAVIAASAVATLGRDVHIRSIKPATSSWSQQGRVLVQGSHNARARR